MSNEKNENESLKNGYVLAKMWNQLLDNPSHNENESLINLNNYAFRFLNVLSTKQKALHENLPELNQIESYVRQKSNLDAYISHEKENLNHLATCDAKSIELIVEDESEPSKDENITLTKSFQNNNNNNNNNNYQSVLAFNSPINEEKARDFYEKIRACLSEDKLNELKIILFDLSSNYDLDFVKFVSNSLLNIEQFAFSQIITQVNLKETQLNALANCLIDLNLSTSILSYSLTCTYLKFILKDFVILSLYYSSSNENAKDLNKVLSRKMFSICSNVCKEFPRQFIDSCMIFWLMKTNNSNMQNNLSNKLLIEFVLKIVRDCFGESESLIFIQLLLNEYSQCEWFDNVYNAVSNLIDKIPSLNTENLSILLNKMKSDSMSMSKSSLFSKLLLNLLNNCKSSFTSGSESLNQDTKPKEKSFLSNENSFLNDLNNLSSLNLNTEAKIVAKNQLKNAHILDTIEVIIENNKTLMKNTLKNIVKSYR